MKNNSIKFKADKHSGLQAEIFFTSVIIEIVNVNNRLNKFKFPFYALTIDRKRNYVDEWIDVELFNKNCDKVLDFVKKNGVTYFKKVLTQMIKETDELLDYSKRINKILASLSNDDLVEEYYKFEKQYIAAYGLGVITFLYEDILSQRLADVLLKKYHNTTDILADVLRSDYKSFMMDSEKALLKIKNTKDKKAKDKLINKYLEDYFYINNGLIYAPSMTKKDVLLASQKIKSGAINKKHKKIAVKLDSNERAIVDLLKVTEIIRDKRKQVNLVGNNILCRFLEQASQRKQISIESLKNIFWFEYRDIFDNKDSLLNKVQKREAVTFVFAGNKFYNLEGIFISEKVKINTNITKLSGTPAAKGMTRGKIKIILGPKDFNKFKKGEVLLTEMTRPDFLPIMRNAKAIITDEGGLTSHAAIVSRELGIPCVVGARGATRIFKDGDVVEVNANSGIIKKI